MPDPAWPASPPEANYLRLAGPGAAGTASTTANAAAWQALAVSHEAGFSASSVNAATTALEFQGIGGSSSTAAITALNTALELLAGWVQEKPPIAASAVAAYEAAVSSMIPAAVSLANRAEQAADVAINPAVFGALTPAIVALDTEYFGEHWPHNASVGAAYGAALAALATALAVPPPLAQMGTAPAGPATAAAAVAQAAGQTVADEAMKVSSQVASMSGDVVGAPAEAVGQLGGMTSTAAQSLGSPAVGGAQPLFGMFGTRLRELQGPTGLPPAGSSVGDGDGLDAADVSVAVPAARAAGISGTAAGGVGGLAGPAGLGGGRAGGLGGFPGAGLTSYARPALAFAPEGSGRPVGLKSGLVGTAEQPGLTTAGAGVNTLPVSPGQAGMLNTHKPGEAKEGVTAARAVLGDQLSRNGGGEST